MASIFEQVNHNIAEVIEQNKALISVIERQEKQLTLFTKVITELLWKLKDAREREAGK